MTFKPWDCAQPDEWLPRSLRLCWGGDSSGGGFGDSSGGGGFGGATTGGGDWGSAGSADFSSFNAGGDLGAWAGTAYDASTSGTGAGAGGDWGSFAATNYSGMNAPNPTFADIAGPNPGVTTGGGDWGSAGVSSFAGTGGGPAGAMFGAATDTGGSFYGGQQGGGLFGDYSGGGPGGFTGGNAGTGGGGGGRSGGPFGGFGTIGTLGASNTGRGSERGGGPDFADTAGSAGGRGAGPASVGRSDAPTRGEAEVASVSPGDMEAGPDSEAAPPAEGEPNAPAPEAEAGPSLSDGAPAGMIGGSRDASPASQAARSSEVETAPNAFGPQTLAQTQQALSDLTQTSLSPQDLLSGMDLAGDRSTQQGDINPNSFFSMGWEPSNAYEGRGADNASGRAAQDYVTSMVSAAPLAAAGPAALSTISALTGGISPGALLGGTAITGGMLTGAINAPESQRGSEQQGPEQQDSYFGSFFNALNPNNWVNEQSNRGMPWEQSGPNNPDTTNWGAVFEAPAQAPDYASVFAAPDQGPDYASVFEGGPTGTDWGSVFEGAAPALDPRSSIEAFIPGGRETNFDYGPMATQLDDPGGRMEAFIPGGRETNFEYATSEANPQQQDQPQDAAGAAIAATGAPQAAQDAATQAATQAMLDGQGPNGQAAAAWGAALNNGATQDQADAIGAAVHAAAQQGQQVVGKSSWEALSKDPGAFPGINLPSVANPNVAPPADAQPDQEPAQEALPQAEPEGINPGAEQYGVNLGLNPSAEQYGINFAPQAAAPSLVDMAQPGATRSDSFIPGGRETNFEYAPTSVAQPSAQPQAQPGATAFVPGGRTTDFNYPSSTSRGIDPGAQQYHLGDQPVSPTPPAPDKTDPPPAYPGSGLNEPANVRSARDYLIETATPGDTMARLGKGDIKAGTKEAIDRLHPEFALRLEKAIKEARAAGIPASIFSAYRAPAFGVNSRGATGWASRSQHGKGAAVDVTGIGARDSKAAREWYDIAIRNGLYNPFGRPGAWRNPKEFNHFQISPQVSTFQFPRQQLGVQPVTGMPPIWSRVDPPGYVPPTQVADVPPAAPLGGWRGIGGDISREARLAQPDIPPAPPIAARPPPDVPLPPPDVPPRPPADIPIDIPVQTVPPAVAARTTQAAMQFAKFLADNLAKSGKLPSNREEGQKALTDLARELAKAGYPAGVAQKTILETATQGSIKAGYGPNSSFNMFGHVTDAINEMAATAMQGYHAGKAPETQGPPAPAAPGKRSEAPSLLDFLGNFNPISTAEARGGRSQAGNLQAPRADPGVIQGRLSSARADIINELQTNLGLRNTLDLIVTGEVGSQGKAAVLGFLETAMNKVAAEAAQQGRTATGRDLLNYLNNRTYFPDTWGKIESGKVRGGALTDDLLGAIGAGSNITGLSTGNSSASSQGSRFGGNPTNATIGKEHYGVENYAHHAAWYNAMGAPSPGRGIGSDYAAGPYDGPAVGAMPPSDMPMRGLAKGGRVDDDEPVVVGEQGPEVFVPDRPGTVYPHIPQTGQPGNIDRWPKVPAPEFPGQYGGVEREIRRQTRAAQDIVPSLMDMINRGQLRFNASNWTRMITDPDLIALGRSRIEDRR